MRYAGERILVPYNFNSESQNALHLATEIASSTNTHITLFHVLDIPDYSGFNSSHIEKGKMELKEFLQNKLDQIIQNQNVDPGFIKSVISIGKTAETILTQTRQSDFGLMIMGYEKQVSPGEKISGSTVEKVLRYADIPILALSEKISLKDIKKLVFATDLQTTPTYVMQQLSRLQNAARATMYVVRVNTRDQWISTREAQSQMNYFQKVHNLNDVTFSTYDALSTEAGILHFAEDIKADMIALGIHHQGRNYEFTEHYHITEDILRKFSRPTWTCTI